MEQPVPAGTDKLASRRRADTPVEIKVQDLATLVAALNRFLMRLSSMPAFQEAGIGLAEWSALSLIATRGDLNNRQLANALGVSPQRVNQITDSLRHSEMISIALSTEDARKKIIAITPAGTARLNELDTKLRPRIAQILKNRPGTLSRVNAIVSKLLMRLVVPAKSDGRKNVMR